MFFQRCATSQTEHALAQYIINKGNKKVVSQHMVIHSEVEFFSDSQLQLLFNRISLCWLYIKLFLQVKCRLNPKQFSGKQKNKCLFIWSESNTKCHHPSRRGEGIYRVWFANGKVSQPLKNLLLKSGGLAFCACHTGTEKHIAGADSTEWPEQEWMYVTLHHKLKFYLGASRTSCKPNFLFLTLMKWHVTS